MHDPLWADHVALSTSTLFARAQSPKPIRIGILSDMSSLYADVTGPGSVAAARMAVEDFQAGKQSRSIEVISADHQNKADIASAIARDWLDRGGVDVIIDVPN